MKLKKQKNSLIIIFILLILIVSAIVYKNRFRYYSIEDKTSNIKKTKFDDSNPIGWIRIQGTKIDFPIFNNSDVDVSSNDLELGWVNTDYRSELEDRSVILSHNVRNVSSKPLIANKNHQRFEQLPSFLYYDFASKNKYVQFSTKNSNNLFKIYSVYIAENFDISGVSLTTKEKEKYIDNAISKSYFKYDVDISSKDKLITLVTCTRFYGDTDSYSIVVEGRKVREKENISNYKVTKNKNYQKIEKKLKGDVSDE